MNEKIFSWLSFLLGACLILYAINAEGLNLAEAAFGGYLMGMHLNRLI